MVQRADLISPNRKTVDLFSDFLNDFSAHPISGDIARLRNETAIRQSIKNIILTNIGERPFQPTIGSNINRALFEPNDEIIANELLFHIETALNNHEPRATILSVSVVNDREPNSVSINIVYSIINSHNPQNLNLILRRVR